jgi:hypothetical protein
MPLTTDVCSVNYAPDDRYMFRELCPWRQIYVPWIMPLTADVCSVLQSALRSAPHASMWCPWAPPWARPCAVCALRPTSSTPTPRCASVSLIRHQSYKYNHLFLNAILQVIVKCCLPSLNAPPTTYPILHARASFQERRQLTLKLITIVE